MALGSHSIAQLTHEHMLMLPGMQKHFSGQPVWQGGSSEHVLSKQVRSTAVNPVCSLGARGILHLVQRERSPLTGPPSPWCPRCYLLNCIPTGGCSCAWLLTQGRHLLLLLLRQPGCQPASEDKKPKSVCYNWLWSLQKHRVFEVISKFFNFFLSYEDTTYYLLKVLWS